VSAAQGTAASVGSSEQLLTSRGSALALTSSSGSGFMRHSYTLGFIAVTSALYEAIRLVGYLLTSRIVAVMGEGHYA